MAIINLTNSGARRSMTDASRWRGDKAPLRNDEEMSRPLPVRAPEPVQVPDEILIVDTAPEIAEPAVALAADDNIDHSLRDRIRRISRRPQQDEPDAPAEAPRARGRRKVVEERAELSDEAFSFTPAGPKGRDKPQRAPAEREPGTIRQSARRRDDPVEAQVPARRMPTEPDMHSTGVRAQEYEIDMLRSEIDELRQEMAEMRDAIGRASQPASSSKGLGAVERTMQRLSERMDRIDGGAQPQISDGHSAPRPRKKGFFSSLFG
jgi:hypothetical protein